mgnify:CR=1 FL=1
MMKFLKIFTLLPLLCLFISMSGQNQYDSQGKKTGYWVVKYPNGRILYESEFIGGEPVGLMKRYYENGSLSAEMMFDTVTDRCYARLYHQNKKLAAEGWYLEQKKDSVWTYYSEYDRYIIIREPYQDGSLDGTAESYFPNGQVAEQTAWEANKKNGEWLLFFDNGNVRTRGSYLNGSREGAFRTYYTEGNIELSGNYVNDVADGEWTLFNEDGSVHFVFKYQSGKLLNESDLLETDDDVLRKLQDLSEPDEIIEY